MKPPPGGQRSITSTQEALCSSQPLTPSTLQGNPCPDNTTNKFNIFAFIMLKYMSHKIHHFKRLKAYNSVALSTRTVTMTRLQNIFITAKGTHPIRRHSPSPFSSVPGNQQTAFCFYGLACCGCFRRMESDRMWPLVPDIFDAS